MTSSPTTMRAATVHRYGGPEVLRIASLPVPELRPGEVRVRVHASPVTAGDVRLRSARVPRGYGLLVRAMFGFTGPRRPIPGWGFSGVIEAVAPDVRELSVGQRVFGVKGFHGGAHAEYLTLSAKGTVLPMPDTLSFEEGAAFFFGGFTAADFLIDKGNMQRGEHLAVVGATGSVGSAALSIGKHLGLTMTAVASASNHDLARSLGASTVIDYRTAELEGRFDGILDVMGYLPRKRALSLLKPGGRLMPVTPTLLQNLGAALMPRRGTARITGSTTSEAREKLERLVELHRVGGYRPIVGVTMPFDQIAEAHRMAETWHKQGNLVLRMREES
jgi:NADPH:quinone reductase-like Zn-dependent oxidoreductase